MNKANLKQAKEWIAQWDEGKPVPTVSMGGLGDEYERALQTIAVEALRFLVWKKPNLDGSEAAVRKVYRELDEAVYSVDARLQSTGAMHGAALNLAAHFYRKGPFNCLASDSAIQDRKITVSKSPA